MSNFTNTNHRLLHLRHIVKVLQRNNEKTLIRYPIKLSTDRKNFLKVYGNRFERREEGRQEMSSLIHEAGEIETRDSGFGKGMDHPVEHLLGQRAGTEAEIVTM